MEASCETRGWGDSSVESVACARSVLLVSCVLGFLMAPFSTPKSAPIIPSSIHILISNEVEPSALGSNDPALLSENDLKNRSQAGR
jgi:hypothetical protein